MINDLAQHIARFLGFILLQALIINHLEIGSSNLLSPYIYFLFILMLPLDIAIQPLLIISFFTGLVMDGFTNTLGIHASACVLIAFLRPQVLKLIAPRDGYDFGIRASYQDLGLTWFLAYGGIMSFIYHFWVIYLEIFRFTNFFHYLLKVILSTTVALLLMILLQYLIVKPGKRHA